MASRIQKRPAGNLTQLYQDPRTLEILDVSTAYGASAVERRAGLIDLGMYRVHGRRFPLGYAVVTADGNGALSAGQAWELMQRIKSDSVDYNGDGTATQVTDAHTLLERAYKIPSNELWNIRNIELELMDADVEGGLVVESDPDIIKAVFERAIATLKINDNPTRLGVTAADLLSIASRIDKETAIDGNATATTAKRLQVQGGREPLLPVPIALTEDDKVSLEVKIVVATPNSTHGNGDVIGMRAVAVGGRYEWAGQ